MFFSKRMNPADLKKIRIEAGLSRQQLAAALDVSFPTIQKWEEKDTEIKMSLKQFEAFLFITAEPEEKKIIKEKFDSLASYWDQKVSRSTKHG